VDWELFDVGRLVERAIAEPCDGWHEPVLSELVEVVAGMPEVECSPAPVDRTGRMEDQSPWGGQFSMLSTRALRVTTDLYQG